MDARIRGTGTSVHTETATGCRGRAGDRLWIDRLIRSRDPAATGRAAGCARARLADRDARGREMPRGALPRLSRRPSFIP